MVDVHASVDDLRGRCAKRPSGELALELPHCSLKVTTVPLRVSPDLIRVKSVLQTVPIHVVHVHGLRTVVLSNNLLTQFPVRLSFTSPRSFWVLRGVVVCARSIV